MYEIPLYSDVGHYKFDIEINNKSLTITVIWNDTIQIWHINIFDNTNNVQLCFGEPLVLGYEITKQFNWDIGRWILIDINANHDNQDAVDATSENLGDSILLINFEV